MSTALDGGAADLPREQAFSRWVGAEVRAQLARHGVRSTEVARRLGVTPSWMSIRLSGKVALSMNDLARIAEVLGMEPVQLLATIVAMAPHGPGPASPGGAASQRPRGLSATYAPSFTGANRSDTEFMQ